MNVDDLVRETRHERGRQHAHIFRQHHVVRIMRFNGFSHQVVMLFTGMAFMAHQFKRNIKPFNQRTQGLVVADNRGDFNIQTAVIGFH